MTHIDVMREAVRDEYPNSLNWSRKVDNMPDYQIQAVYARLCEAGTLHGKTQKAAAPKNQRRPSIKTVKPKEEPEYVQITMEEVLKCL